MQLNFIKPNYASCFKEEKIMNPYEYLKLENQLCFSLYAASREVIKLYKPFLDPYGLTYTQYLVMLVLWEEEKIAFKELGQKLHLDSGTLTPVLKKIVSMGLAEKYRDQADDRNVIVELTSEGLALKEKMVTVPEAIYCKVGGEANSLLALKAQLDQLLGQLTSV